MSMPSSHPEAELKARLATLTALAAIGCAVLVVTAPAALAAEVRYYPVPAGSQPHDVAAAPDGTVWYTAQRSGQLGILDPKIGRTEHVALGGNSSPHGVIAGPDGAAWITDSGQNAIVRVDPKTRAVKLFPLPKDTPYANLNTAAFDAKGVLWYTGQSGYYGSVNPATGDVKVWNAPGGRGPYGIAATPRGDIYYASLAGNHIAKIDAASGKATIIEPPTRNQGARRVWSDSQGRIWVAEWNSGNLSRYDPRDRSWKMYKPPADNPRTYSVYVDDRDRVWITEWTTNAILRFDAETQTWASFPSSEPNAQVRQMLGRPGEAWGAESARDRLVVVRDQ